MIFLYVLLTIHLEYFQSVVHCHHAWDKQLFSKFIKVMKLTLLSRFKQIWRLTALRSSGRRSGIRVSTWTSSSASYLLAMWSIILSPVVLSNLCSSIHSLRFFCRFLHFCSFVVLHSKYICRPTSASQFNSPNLTIFRH